ncbi:putative late blight resistance protein homolog R1B-14 isoform X1 [Lycium barbarum]|uniref:putative late blight resistance protein homolog R1B-14 isoform X1 n=1 Tax=Lycium barbarum TaxID=112863 RepID=UPI00293E77A1|nr:putative late blight resistance protein homolog R1B-14 isoform X1 [Lycium barbarum]
MAYAAITCLMRTINQSMELTGCDLQPFYAKLESLRAILDESCDVTGDLEALTRLEVEIAEVAYSAEDMVDSKSIKVSLAETAITRTRAFWKLCCSLEQGVERIDSIMKKWMAVRNWYRKIIDLKAQTFSLASTIPEHAVERPEHIMVGHENAFKMMQDQLTRGEREREVVSIVGMGGIGKTTLATKLYSDPFIMSHFDILAKATVSQEYCPRNVLLALLSSTSDEPYDQLADRLQKHLKGKRYLAVIDDIWTTGAWDDIQLCLPDCNNRSRILLTTRNGEVAEYASLGKPPHHMRLLNFDESWNLLYKKVFVQDCFPPEFEQLGKQIASKCGGLPLAIIVIGGLLSKTGKTLDEWQSVAKNVSTMVSTDLEAQCMRVLALSYHHLPSHLKPCFLYFAIFAEDELISAHKLVELWAVEGFLKVEETKNMEEVAKTCINELIDRSLISNGGKMTSYCKMHDLIRELCLKEARKMNFVNVLRGKSDQNSCAQSIQCSSKSRGRIGIHSEEELARCRSSEAHSIIMLGSFQCFALELPFKLVRVLDLASVDCEAFPSGILHLIHLRYLALCLYPLLKQYRSSEEEIPSSIIDVPSSIIDIPPSISSLCYLQTFILRTPFHFGYGEYPFILPSEILTMPQLRHLHLSWNYLRYYEPTEKSLVLKNLQCLSGWNPFNCTGSAFGLFPNLKKLQISGDPKDFLIRKDQYDFRYLHQLEELEFILSNKAAKCFLERITPSDSTLETPLMLQRIIKQPKLGLSFPPPPDAFPQNLKNLTLKGLFFLLWKDLSIVGKLPKLESLQLINCRGGWEWEVAEEGFLRLKFLLLNQLDILYWSASSDHFPCLERLFLYGCINLDSIPQEFVDITTLTLIDIDRCRKSVGNSAKQIQQDIQDVYGGSIDVHIHRPLSW